MNRIDESTLKETRLIGAKCLSVEKKIENLIDTIENDSKDIKMFNFFDIKGTVLLHGIAGGGKTSIAKNAMLYALNKYGLEAYLIKPSEIITSGLGESVKNLADELQRFEKLDEGILFIDEIDKFFINRTTQDELSELKRLLIEMMNFIDNLSVDKKKILIGCTNVYRQMDDALKRRFSICEEIGKPSKNEKIEFCRICLHTIGLTDEVDENSISDTFLSEHETMDSIKSYFRNKIIMNQIDSINNEIIVH
ncbi:AAA family ATPase [Treponema saccharophilum]|uniref:AAA ATPase central domain protein n=1 Tax=Treponema saccharophilum DSM 2985 TaxID=907348 RepID=H7EN40_9SPIR|nr:ATP-binding protein [Treponema saccharophilum]EIC01104.1 AAA ATPase central domain protein [Treponema saccharophilum DSM 2985]BDC95417.1 hypothetical protein TRSA_05160 [Treponema saccharophilum]